MDPGLPGGDPNSLLATLFRQLVVSQTVSQAENQRLLSELLRKDSSGPRTGGGGVRVKSEVSWPSWDNSDPYYDIAEFFKDYYRVLSLATSNRQLAGHERLELLRGALRGTPLLEFRNFVDDHPVHSRVLLAGTPAERDALYAEVELHLAKTFHRPALERQKRARAEMEALNMRADASLSFFRPVPRRVPQVPGEPASLGTFPQRGRGPAGVP